ncbi:MAG: CHRD domain-containing protein [Polyangiales bacterium]
MNVRVILLGAAVALGACSDPVATPPADTGPVGDTATDLAADVAPDAAPDVSQDAAPDAAPDATPDAAPDATPDATADATPDVGLDATADATPDVTPDVTPDAGAGTMFVATLTGAEEVPVVRSTATGTATFVLADDRRTLTYTLRHNAAGATAGHLHLGFPGESGAVMVAFPTVTPDTMLTGSLTLTATQADQLANAQVYVNIHTPANPGGELRGQVLRPGERLFVTTLSGAEQAPPVRTAATATGWLALSADRSTARYRVAYTGLTPTQAHVHLSPAGVVGAVAFNLTAAGAGVYAGATSISAVQATALEEYRAYFNLHSDAFGGGELRGQLLAPGAQLFVGALSGAQENPPVATAATGNVQAVLNYARNDVRYHVVTVDLTGASAAHFHRGVAGVNGPVAVALTLGTGAAFGGNVTLAPADADLLEGGRLYTNVHTAANAGGELRAQLTRPGEELFVAQLSGAQENPPVATTSGGAAQVLLGVDGRSARVAASTTAAPSAAHIHTAIAGVNGGVTVGITTPGPEMNQSATLTAEQASDLAGARMYFNVHTAANPGGEVRGQFLRPGETVWVARLNGAQENPPVTTTATATGMVVVRANGASIAYSVDQTIAPTAAHIHTAPGGANGPVTIAFMSVGGMLAGTASVTAAQLADLRAGRWYMNLHTIANPGGEVRGQVLRPGEVLYTAQLTGAQEVPPVTTPASGALAVIVNPAGTVATYDGAFTGVGTTVSAAHLHGPTAAGSNAGVLYPLTVMGSSLVGTQTLTATDLAALNGGMVYANVHTAANPGGELRGQLARR